jgi:hypothetical protein
MQEKNSDQPTNFFIALGLIELDLYPNVKWLPPSFGPPAESHSNR